MKYFLQSLLAMFSKPVDTLPDYLIRHFEAQANGDFDWRN